MKVREVLVRGGGDEEGDGAAVGEREEKERRLSPSEGYVISACAACRPSQRRGNDLLDPLSLSRDAAP